MGGTLRGMTSPRNAKPDPSKPDAPPPGRHRPRMLRDCDDVLVYEVPGGVVWDGQGGACFLPGVKLEAFDLDEG